MKKITLGVVLFAIVAVAVSGCTNAQRAEIGRYGSDAQIEAYDFGVLVYSGESEGKLKEKEGGYLFVEKGTGDTIQVKGSGMSFVIRYPKEEAKK